MPCGPAADQDPVGSSLPTPSVDSVGGRAHHCVVGVLVRAKGSGGRWAFPGLALSIFALVLHFTATNLAHLPLAWAACAAGALGVVAFSSHPVAQTGGRLVVGAASSGTVLLGTLDFGQRSSWREGSRFILLGFLLALMTLVVHLSVEGHRAAEERQSAQALEARWRLEDARHAELLAALRASVRPKPGGGSFTRALLAAAVGAMCGLVASRRRQRGSG
jgi:hypothetical protein